MPLDTHLEQVFRLNPHQKQALSKLGLLTVHDLLYHFPARYSDVAELKSISELRANERASVYGRIVSIETKKTYRTNKPMSEGMIEDHTGKIRLVWWNQPYIAKMIHEGDTVKIDGHVQARRGGQARSGGDLYIANPEIERSNELPIDTGNSLFHEEETGDLFAYPVYPESRGITSKWFYHAMRKILAGDELSSLEDPIPADILKKYNLPGIHTAMFWIHAPKKPSHSASARKRFAFEEVLYIQLSRQRLRREFEKREAFALRDPENTAREFVERLPFPLTNAQDHAVTDIISDFKKNTPMSRLLEGDVGSGKTAVAAATVYSVVTSPPAGHNVGHLQAAYMAPTEILATQHFESFIEYFKHLPIGIGLITGSGCKKFPSKVDPSTWTKISRTQLLKWVESGEISMLVGTHSLIQKSVAFKHLAYVIVDEQHRFGVKQRQKLTKKHETTPHFLSMTATPIPRTLALTIYGDLDLTLLDEMPAGRKKIITDIVPAGKRDSMYEKVRAQLEAGRQAYIICPRIDEPDPEKEQALQARSVKEEAKRLKKDVFQKYRIEELHGKMLPKDKEAVMERFAAHEIDILVATSVVEVGVNVPNATVIVIEGAERFGLSQLHQLRGRVLRGTHQPYCFLLSEARAKTSAARLRALKTAKNGFELSEHDLHLRGAGELSGGKQWGVSDIGMEAIKNIKMVEAARTEARALLEKDPELKNFPLLQKHLSSTEVHFE